MSDKINKICSGITIYFSQLEAAIEPLLINLIAKTQIHEKRIKSSTDSALLTEIQNLADNKDKISKKNYYKISKKTMY